MGQFDLSEVASYGAPVLSKSSIMTLSRAFKLAKPIANIVSTVNPDSKKWLEQLTPDVDTGAAWVRLLYFGVDVLDFLKATKARVGLVDLFGDIEGSSYVFDYLEGLGQTFPVYPDSVDHANKCYLFFSSLVAYWLSLHYPDTVVRVGGSYLLVRADGVKVGTAKTLIAEAQDTTPFNPTMEEKEEGNTCTVECTKHLTLKVYDNPSIQVLTQMSRSDGSKWSYVDFDNQHLAGRIAEVILHSSK